MGTFLGVAGLGVVFWAVILFAGGIFGEAGMVVVTALSAAGLVTCGLKAYWRLDGRLQRIEEKLDALNTSKK